MKNTNLSFLRNIVFATMLISISCNENDCSVCQTPSDNDTTATTNGNASLAVKIRGNIGLSSIDEFTAYIQELNLMLFQENNNGDFTLQENRILTWQDLQNLTSGTSSSTSTTTTKTVVFDSLVIGTYQVIGLANIRDTLGNVLNNAALQNAMMGSTIEDVMVIINDSYPAPRLFYGNTGIINLGEGSSATPSIELTRNVGMFMLNIANVPNVVSQINISISNTYNSFDMSNTFGSGTMNVYQKNIFDLTDSISQVFTYTVTLPTFSGGTSQVGLTFVFENGQSINIPLQSGYIIKSNTVTQQKATINTEQNGSDWTINLSLEISADVVWNIEQEPPIII